MRKIMKTIAVMCVLCLVFGTVGASADVGTSDNYEVADISAVAGSNVIVGAVKHFGELTPNLKVVITYLNSAKRAGKKYKGQTNEYGLFVIKTAKLKKGKTYLLSVYDKSENLAFSEKFEVSPKYFNLDDAGYIWSDTDNDFDYPFIVSCLKGTKVIVGWTKAGAYIQLRWKNKVTESVADADGFFRIPLKSNLTNGKEILMYVESDACTTKYLFKSGYTGFLNEDNIKRDKVS